MSSDLEHRKLRRIYSEILNGFSLSVYKNRNIYIKHFSTLDNFETDFLYSEYYDNAVKRKYPTEKEKLELLERDGLWSKFNEDKIEEKRQQIQSLFSSKRKAYLKRDIDHINNEIKKAEDNLLELYHKREELIGATAEKYAKRNIDSIYIKNGFFIDRELKSALFSDSEFDSLDSRELEELYEIYYANSLNLLEKNIKKIALMDFFLNNFQLTDNIYEFLGKPIAHLTYYQTQLCAYGNFYKTIMSSDTKPPEKLLKDPDALEDWYFGRRNVEEVMNRNKSDDAQLVGLTNEERKYLGLDVVPTIDIRKRAMENGGEIPMHELMKLEGF